MRRFYLLATLVVLVCGTASSSGAQATEPGPTELRLRSIVDSMDAREGSRVRFSTRGLQDRLAIGTLASVRVDSLWLRHDPHAPPIPFPRSALTRFEVSGGHPGLARRSIYGALIGGAGAMLVGSVVSAGMTQCYDCNNSATGARLAVTGAFGVVGGFVGMLVGAGTVGPEVWRPARLVAKEP